jgi:hypothetical protein
MATVSVRYIVDDVDAAIARRPGDAACSPWLPPLDYRR